MGHLKKRCFWPAAKNSVQIPGSVTTQILSCLQLEKCIIFPMLFLDLSFPKERPLKRNFLYNVQFHEFPDKFPTNIGCDAYFVVFFSRISTLCYQTPAIKRILSLEKQLFSLDMVVKNCEISSFPFDSLFQFPFLLLSSVLFTLRGER